MLKPTSNLLLTVALGPNSCVICEHNASISNTANIVFDGTLLRKLLRKSAVPRKLLLTHYVQSSKRMSSILLSL